MTPEKNDLAALNVRLDELENSERRYRLLANATRQVMAVFVPTGAAVFFNDHFVQYTGLPREETQGMNWAQTVHPEDLPELMRRREAALQNRTEYEFRIRLRRHDGAYRWHMGRTIPVIEENVVQSWVGTASDVHDLVETERALRESESRFKLTSEVIPQLIWIALPQGNVEYYSPRWYAYTGLTEGAARGNGWEKVLHPDDVEPTKIAWVNATQMGAPFVVEQRLKGADGRFRWFLTQAQPFKDELGDVVRWYGTCTEIEDQKKLSEDTRRSSERLELALEAGRMGAWEWEIGSEKVNVTPSFAALHGLMTPDALVSTLLIDAIIHPDDREERAAAGRAAIADRAVLRSQYRVVLPDGRIRWIEARGRAYSDQNDRPTRLAGVAWDITELKETTKELARRAEELVRSNKELEQFAFVASHDLKEPLRKIAGYAELIQSRYQSKLDEKGERFLNYLQEGVRRMDTIIGDLLAYSRAGRGAHEKESVDVGSVVAEVVDDLEKVIEEAKAKVEVGKLPTLPANRTQLRQVFQNLIANALKFHGDIDPRVYVTAERTADVWRFTVKDNGIGIDGEYFDRIFEIFQRLHTRTEYPGTGIGLAICKKIVETHGGRIWVESQKGAGSAFHFTIPA